MSDVGKGYRFIGQDQDSLALFKATLEFRRRNLPENDPKIG